MAVTVSEISSKGTLHWAGWGVRFSVSVFHLQQRVFPRPVSWDPSVHQTHTVAGARWLEACQRLPISHSLPSASKTAAGPVVPEVGDPMPVPNVRSASADCKKAERVKWGEAEERAMLRAAALVGEESRLTGPETWELLMPVTYLFS